MNEHDTFSVPGTLLTPDEARRAKFNAEQADLARRFAYHPPVTDKKKDAHGEARSICWDAATNLAALVPDGREKSIMLTKLEEAMYWANAGIARKEA